jgi:hypothetical protein
MISPYAAGGYYRGPLCPSPAFLSPARATFVVPSKPLSKRAYKKWQRRQREANAMYLLGSP